MTKPMSVSEAEAKRLGNSTASPLAAGSDPLRSVDSQQPPRPGPVAISPDTDYLLARLPELVQRMRDQQTDDYDIWERLERVEADMRHLTTLVSMVVELTVRQKEAA